MKKIQHKKFKSIIKITCLAIVCIFSKQVFSSENLLLNENIKNNDTPQYLYKKLKPKIVQIKILGNATGEKASLGSGFVIGKSNIIATNYHVISQIANSPDEYHGTYRKTDNSFGTFELLSFDVINDLAILKADQDIDIPMKIASLPAKGNKLYSLGNPNDLGFVIINGINNGLIDKANPPRVLFSASINSGMSGGPAVNSNGEIVAVNVAIDRRSGDTSFLVPGKYLQQLLDKVAAEKFIPPKKPKATWNKTIDEQLLAESKTYFDNLKTYQREYITLGNLRFPTQIGPSFKCWEKPQEKHKEQLLVKTLGVSCHQSRQHYITDRESHGIVQFSYQYSKAKKPIHRRQFYRYIELIQSIDEIGYFGSKRHNNQNAVCNSKFITIASHEFKVNLCSQNDQIRNQIAITDVIATSVEDDNEAWGINIRIDGSTIEEALEFTKSIFKDIKPI
ncbi:MAG: trypsin-like peptidase domain-containing protein [Gammaproteobacteria bacterium]|nr:trypsin-like peptidase domain-containing protein [Gammaproteobacteria bacterium]